MWVPYKGPFLPIMSLIISKPENLHTRLQCWVKLNNWVQNSISCRGFLCLPSSQHCSYRIHFKELGVNFSENKNAWNCNCNPSPKRHLLCLTNSVWKLPPPLNAVPTSQKCCGVQWCVACQIQQSQQSGFSTIHSLFGFPASYSFSFYHSSRAI